MDAKADALRFSQQHAWYRRLTPGGEDFLVFPWQGQQPKTPFAPDVADPHGMHWWFWSANDIDEIPIHGAGKDILMRRPVRLNCFFRGTEGSQESPVVHGWAVIERRFPKIQKQLKRTYAGVDLSQSQGLALVFQAEHQRQVDALAQAAEEIAALFRARCPEWLAPQGAETAEPPTEPSAQTTSRGAETPVVPPLNLASLAPAPSELGPRGRSSSQSSTPPSAVAGASPRASDQDDEGTSVSPLRNAIRSLSARVLSPRKKKP